MNKNVRRLTLAAALGLAIAGSNALAEEMEEVVVKGDLGSLPGERVESIFGFDLKGLRRKDYRDKVNESLEQVGLFNSKNLFPHQLSGGMKQRVMIAMALSTMPKLLLADEPTTALDVTIQAQVINLIKDIIKEYQMGVIFITHDLGVIAQVADEVAVMYLGSILEKGPVNRISKNLKHPYTKGLLQALPDVNNLDEPLRPIPGNIPSPLDRPSGCVFRTRCPNASHECSQGMAEMGLIEVEPGHWVDKCCINCG